MSTRTRRGRRVRARLILTVVGIVTVAAVALSALAYVLVSRSLRTEVLDRAVDEAQFGVGVLAAERLGETVAPGDIEASGLAADFERRDINVYVDFDEGEDFVSSLAVAAAPDIVSGEVPELLGAGNVAAEWVKIDGVPYLVTAARKPPSGPDFYFLTASGDVESALAQLRVVLLGASAALVLVAGLAGWRMAHLGGSLADTVDELTAARDRERRFVSDVSHELRTPVTALVNEAAELSREIDSLPAGTRRVVELLDDDIRKLHTLVEDLLELSTLDASGDADGDEPAEVEVARLLEAVVEQRLPSAMVQADAGLRVRLERRRLERIVANLVDNARVHGGGRSVTVRADVTDASLLVVQVADRGPGVPDDGLERIFDRFSMGDAARSGAGSGLGLAIVREHARLMGASVAARNRNGGGLTIEVRVPVSVVTDL